MKRTTLALILSLVLVLLALPTSAQEATPEATTETPLLNARNYCAGQVSYTLPDGWSEGALMRTGASVSRKIATDAPSLSDAVTLLDPKQASVVVGIIDRTAVANAMHLDPNLDLPTMMRDLLAQPASEHFTTSDVLPTSINGHSAMQVSGYSDTKYQYALFISFDSETLGIVLLTANPNERTRWNTTVLALANSLTFDVPRFLEVADSLPLTQSYLGNDCSVAFAFPDGWTETPISSAGASVFEASMTNSTAPSANNVLDPGQARLELQVTPASQANSDPGYYSSQFIQQAGYKIVSQTYMMITGRQTEIVEVQISSGGKQIGDALQIAILDDDHSIATLALYSAPGELDQWRATALAVAESLQVNLSNSITTEGS